MTDQYQQQNINSPKVPRQVTALPATTQVPLNADDSLVAIDSSAALGAFDFLLPFASEVPGAVITVVASTGAAVPIAPQVQVGNTLVIPAGLAPATILATNNATARYQSDGGDNWYMLSSVA